MSDMQKLIESFGCNLYDTEIEKASKTIYRVLIHKDGGISLDELAQISRSLSPLLDVNPPMNCPYTLEVSSPGLERKLRTIDHFIKAIGTVIRVKIGNKNIKGKLLNVNDSTIVLATKKGEETLNINDIVLAKTVFEWKESEAV